MSQPSIFNIKDGLTNLFFPGGIDAEELENINKVFSVMSPDAIRSVCDHVRQNTQAMYKKFVSKKKWTA